MNSNSSSINISVSRNEPAKPLKEEVEKQLSTTIVLDESSRGPSAPPTVQGSPLKQDQVPPQQPQQQNKKKQGCIAQFFHLSLAKLHPHNLLMCLALFLVLCAAGIAALVYAKTREDEKLQEDAIALAEETGGFFSDQLDQAILPLFSMAQFVNEIPIFKNLSSEIGQAYAPGSLPLLPGKDNDDGSPTHRNITGVCDEPGLVQHFDEIAATVKYNAGMEKVLVNLQLAPGGVVCLAYPLNNTDDFPPGIFMDNTGVIGLDLLTDPSRKFIAEATILSETVVIAGPLKLKQCHDCDPTVEKAFIARYPIALKGTEIVVNGIPYQKWGFVVALINWNALVEKSGVFEIFRQEGLEFQLTRTDKKSDPETNEITETVVVLAETPNFSHGTGHRPKVTAALQTTDNEWEMTVAYGNEFPLWFPLGVLGTVLLAFFISFLVYTLLTQTLIYKKDLAEKNYTLIQNARASAKTEREFNDFIAHEVRNPLSAAMSAASFISSAVNEREPLTMVEDQQAVQDDITIIESSLQFVNDLLRNMLDFHRATSKELHLETTATDVQRDILEPVAAMLYRRYDNYQVIVDCPKDLYIMTDRLRLKQIVLNLGRNSAKFVETGFVRLKAEVIDDNVTISVEDSGPGIPEEKRRHLYDRFQESLDTLSQGTGIGLNLCLKLINLMEGKIWLDESYHSGIEGCPGARFVIELNTPPLTLESSDLFMEDGSTEEYSSMDFDNDNNCPQPLRSMSSSPQHSALSCTIPVIEELPENLSALFVDDDMILRKLFVRSVKKICPTWTIQEAGNGETALQMAGSKHFDLIFLDQYMTSVDKQLLGTETAHALRGKGFDGVICGVSANDVGHSFIKAGANAFVNKPFPCKAAPLTNELRHILSSKRSEEISY